MIAAVVLIGGAFYATRSNDTTSSTITAENVSVVGGEQIITLAAKGGFSPRTTTAEAGVPSVLRVSTSGTYDCSSAISIPSLGYNKNLPPSGTTDIDIPAQAAGTTLEGTCSMGMYRFAVAFE